MGSSWGTVLGDIADAVDGLRLGVDALDDTVDNPGSAGVDGGGWGPGGLSESAEGAEESEPSGTRLSISDNLGKWVGAPCCVRVSPFALSPLGASP